MTMLNTLSQVEFSLVACARPKKTAGITTAMTIPHRAPATPSARFLIGYPRYAASSPKATAPTATTPTRIVGYKGLARGRGKAAGNVHPAHGELHGENPEQEQRAQHQSKAEVGPPRPADVETVVAHPAMIEYATRQIQRRGDQKREHQRPN